MYGIDKGLHRPEGQNRKFRKINIWEEVAEAVQQMVLE